MIYSMLFMCKGSKENLVADVLRFPIAHLVYTRNSGHNSPVISVNMQVQREQRVNFFLLLFFTFRMGVKRGDIEILNGEQFST